MKKTVLIILSVMLLSIPAFAQRDTMKAREVGLVFSSLNSFGLCYKTGNENTLFRIMALTNTGSSSTTNYKSVISNGNSDTVTPSPSNSFSLSLNVGIEKRKSIGNRFYFYYGLNLISSFSSSNSTTTTPTTSYLYYFNSSDIWTVQSPTVNNTSVTKSVAFSEGLGLVCGVAYKLSKRFTVSAELVPSCSYNYMDTKIQVTSSIVEMVPEGRGYTPIIYTNNGFKEMVAKGISYSILNSNAAMTIAYRIK